MKRRSVFWISTPFHKLSHRAVSLIGAMADAKDAALMPDDGLDEPDVKVLPS